MASLRLYLLGTPRLERGRRPLPLGRRKTLGLLCYLAARPGAHGRETLASLLWPDAEPARAHAYLRNAVWLLRHQAGEATLAADQETIGLGPEPDLWVDLDEFRRLLAAASRTLHPKGDSAVAARLLEEAVGHYQGRFLAGFGLRDSYAFEEWQLQQEDRCQAELAGALKELVGIYARGGRFDRAIEHGRRWLALDPLDESVQRALMDLYGRAGQRSAALELYARSARLLRDELGLRPADETTALRARIAAGELGAATPPTPRRAGGRVLQSTRRPTPPMRLPAAASAFLGREAELKTIDQILGQSNHRQLTLIGPGGSGKSRLALEAAQRRRRHYGDGVFFVPLAAVAEPEFIVAAIVEALGAQLPGKGDLVATEGSVTARERALLVDFLSGKQMLLVLDNLEHLLPRVEIIAEILACAPRLQVLVTSRERTRLQGESVLELSGLPCPEPQTSSAEYRSSSAIQLFRQAARRVRPSFEVSGRDLEPVARICRLVEGNPLAIELAAAWVRMLSCTEILSEIEASFDFLAAQSADLPPRHRSLRAVFDHSWALLSSAEQRALRRLAIFRGRFDREAAQAVTGTSLAVLTALGDKSLLRRRGPRRFEIQEVLRQYAAEHLAAAQDEELAMQEALARHYLERLARQEGALKSGQQRSSLKALAEDVENIRSAWLWAARRRWVGPMKAAFMSLFLFYDMRSRFPEGTEMCREAFELLNAGDGQADPILAGLLLAGQGWFLNIMGVAGSQQLFRRSRELLARASAGSERAFVTLLAWITAEKLEDVLTLQDVAEARATFAAAGDLWGTALALEVLAFASAQDRRGEALRYGYESLRLRRRIGDGWGVALALYVLGHIAEQAGLPHVARRRYRESIRLRRRMGGDLAGIASCLIDLGRVDRRQGRFLDAARRYRKCWLYARRMGHRLQMTRTRLQLGLLAYELRRPARARSLLESALALAESLDIHAPREMAHALLANVALAGDEPGEAELHLAALRSAEPDHPVTAPAKPSGDPEAAAMAARPWSSLARARVAWRAGRHAAARADLRTSLMSALRVGDDPTALEALAEAGEMLAPGETGERGPQLWQQILQHPAASPLTRARCIAYAEAAGRPTQPGEVASPPAPGPTPADAPPAEAQPPRVADLAAPILSLLGASGPEPSD